MDWRQAGDDVRRLRQRIFTASEAGDLKKVRNLQKLMLRSRANSGSPDPRPKPRRSSNAWPGSCTTTSNWNSTRPRQ
ncbi:reverse transcriptase N-terminal domain-containing protein [Nonomuraea solani]|uniref:reverse transcriptase N-terminal domain-containing protein n=1 Tax=Nonomuraea solani TaxID=1144553 RepID=UPI003899426E